MQHCVPWSSIHDNNTTTAVQDTLLPPQNAVKSCAGQTYIQAVAVMNTRFSEKKCRCIIGIHPQNVNITLNGGVQQGLPKLRCSQSATAYQGLQEVRL